MHRHKDFTGDGSETIRKLTRKCVLQGKLWISLGYDSNGFESGVIEGWWKELLAGVDEFLLSEGGTA